MVTRIRIDDAFKDPIVATRFIAGHSSIGAPIGGGH